MFDCIKNFGPIAPAAVPSLLGLQPSHLSTIALVNLAMVLKKSNFESIFGKLAVGFNNFIQQNYWLRATVLQYQSYCVLRFASMGHRRQIDRINFPFLSCLDLCSLGTRLYTIISKTSLVGEWYDHYCESQTTEYCGADGFTVIGMHLVCSWGCRPHSSNRSVFEGKSWCSPVSLCCDWLLLHGCSRQVVAYLNVGLVTCQQETVLHWTLSW